MKIMWLKNTVLEVETAFEDPNGNSHTMKATDFDDVEISNETEATVSMSFSQGGYAENVPKNSFIKV